jgi:hypothetical protein
LATFGLPNVVLFIHPIFSSISFGTWRILQRFKFPIPFYTNILKMMSVKECFTKKYGFLGSKVTLENQVLRFKRYKNFKKSQHSKYHISNLFQQKSPKKISTFCFQSKLEGIVNF